MYLLASNIRELPAPEKFFVIRGRVEPWIDSGLYDRHGTIKAIASEYSNLHQIVGFSLVTGTCRDATSDIVGSVVQRWAEDGEILDRKQRDFVASFMGEVVANSFQMEDA